MKTARAAHHALFRLDYLRVKVAVAARSVYCSCSKLPQRRHDVADAVRLTRPKGKRCRHLYLDLGKEVIVGSFYK